MSRVLLQKKVALPGPYYSLATIGTVPRAYDIFRAYEGMGGRKIK
jgi:hypothetical protein